MGSLIKPLPSGINLNNYSMLIGILSISLKDNSNLSFKFEYDATDISFPSDSIYNEVQYLWITQLSCGTGTYIDRVEEVCKN